jgi:hypothetical protein
MGDLKAWERSTIQGRDIFFFQLERIILGEEEGSYK